MFKVYPTAKIMIDENIPPECCGHLKCMKKNPKMDGCPGHPFKHGKDGDIGDFTFIRAKKLTLGEGVHIAPRVTIVGNGSVEIGDYSTIAPGVVIYTSIPDLHYGTNKYAEEFKSLEGDVKIGKNVFVGSGAVLSQGSVIPDNAVVPAHMYVNAKTKFRERDNVMITILNKKGEGVLIREMKWKPK